MSATTLLNRLLVVWTGLTVSACSTTMPVDEFRAYLDDRDAPRLLVQVCLPDHTAFFDEVIVDVTNVPIDVPHHIWAKMFIEARKSGTYDNPYKSSSTSRSYSTIRQWRLPSGSTDFQEKWLNVGTATNTKGIRSLGGGSGYLTDTTEKDQPVFLEYTGTRPEDVEAIYVTLTVRRNDNSVKSTFWFKPTSDIRANTYTGWTSPLSEEGPKEQAARNPTGWLIAHGKEMPIFKVGEGAPRIRYSVMSRRDYGALEKARRSAINFAKLERMTAKQPTDEKQLHFVPERREKIPPC